jgi:hypothetical protein
MKQLSIDPNFVGALTTYLAHVPIQLKREWADERVLGDHTASEKLARKLAIYMEYLDDPAAD